MRQPSGSFAQEISAAAHPKNWPMLVSDDHSATDLLAQQYEDHLVPGLKLGDLVQPPPPGKPTPNFIFAASNLQTGVSFAQCADHVADYRIGYADLPDMRVSDAVAASSAFPIAFPPLILKFESVKFGGDKLGNSDVQRQLARRIVLTDGSVYDNLGLEPVWKTDSTVFCSDGGKPFGIVADPGEIIRADFCGRKV
jgi:NTE family protein